MKAKRSQQPTLEGMLYEYDSAAKDGYEYGKSGGNAVKAKIGQIEKSIGRPFTQEEALQFDDGYWKGVMDAHKGQ